MNQGLFILFTRNKIMMRTTKSVLEVKIHNTMYMEERLMWVILL